MTGSDPVTALSGVRTGHICDSCNRGVLTGDLVRGYSTYYEKDGWIPRRLWCDDCGSTTINEGTPGADELILQAVFWNHRLVSVQFEDRSPPSDGQRS